MCVGGALWCSNPGQGDLSLACTIQEGHGKGCEGVVSVEGEG